MTDRRGYGVRTLCQSGDHWRGYRVGGVGDRGVMDIRVRRGRKNGWICEDVDFSVLGKVFLPIDL